MTQIASPRFSRMTFALKSSAAATALVLATPDRALMPRLMGAVHTTKQYPLEGFTDAEWQSEERDRYVREYLNDVNLAKAKLAELEKIIGPVKKP